MAHLCLSGRPPRAAIAGHLWPDVPEDHAHGSLRSALWRLHKAAPGLVEVTGSSLALADGVRVDVRQLRMHALEMVAERLSGAGRHGDALQAAYAAVHAEPLRESAHRTVVRVHLTEGNLAEALRAYERFHALLSDELGVAPSEHMTRLVHALRRPRPAVPEPRRPKLYAVVPEARVRRRSVT